MVSRGAPVAEQIDGILNNQVLKFTVVNGAAANADIAIADIATADKIVGVAKLDFTLSEDTPNTRTWEASDLTSAASVTSAGNIQPSVTHTTS